MYYDTWFYFVVTNFFVQSFATRPAFLFHFASYNQNSVSQKGQIIPIRSSDHKLRQTETGFVLIRSQSNKADDRIGMINPFFKLELVSRHTKVQASALQTFADVFVECFLECRPVHFSSLLFTLTTKMFINKRFNYCRKTNMLLIE